MSTLTILLAIFLQIYVPRIASINREFLTPVATDIMCSDEERHVRRGSVYALDLCVPYGSPVFPAMNGTITYAGCNNAGGYGCWVMVKHQNGFTSLYAHMIAGSIRVKAGDVVDVNTVLGQVGWTGITSFGPHVHWEMRYNGNRIKISDYLDMRLMKDIPLYTFPKDTAQYIPKGMTFSNSNYRSAERSYTLVIAVFVFYTFYFLFWLMKKHKNDFFQQVHNAAVGVSLAKFPIVLTLAIVFSPVHAGGSPSFGYGELSTNEQYNIVYKFIESWEGNADKCVFDPVKTKNGVTNSTYNLWRRSEGLGPADVCRDMTQQEKMTIYYKNYYVASGANTLPLAISLHHMDIAMLSGPSKAKEIYAKCGDDFACYTQQKATWFRSLKNCPLYCNAWLRRNDDVAKYLKTGVANGREIFTVRTGEK